MNDKEILKILTKVKVFKNYKEMCNALGWKYYNGGDSRKAQFKDLSCYCNYEKQGQKIIILEVFDEPKERVCRNQKRDAKYDEIMDIIYYNFVDRIKAINPETKEITLCLDTNEIITHCFVNSMSLLFDNSTIYKKHLNRTFSKNKLIGCISTAFKHCSYVNEKSVAVHVALMLNEKDSATDDNVVVRLDKHQETVWKDFDSDLVELLGFENINASFENFGNTKFSTFDNIMNACGNIGGFNKNKTDWNNYLRGLYLKNNDLFEIGNGSTIPKIMLKIRRNFFKEKLNVIRKIDYLEFTINVEEFLAYEPKMALEDAITTVFERKFDTFLEGRKQKEGIEVDECFGGSNLDGYINLKESYRPATRECSMIENLYLESSEDYEEIDNLEENCKAILQELEARVNGSYIVCKEREHKEEIVTQKEEKQEQMEENTEEVEEQDNTEEEMEEVQEKLYEQVDDIDMLEVECMEYQYYHQYESDEEQEAKAEINQEVLYGTKKVSCSMIADDENWDFSL